MREQLRARLRQQWGLVGRALYSHVLKRAHGEKGEVQMEWPQASIRELAYRWCLGGRLDEMGSAMGQAAFGRELDRIWASAGLLTRWRRKVRAGPSQVRAAARG